jgi:hypothetical protein
VSLVIIIPVTVCTPPAAAATTAPAAAAAAASAAAPAAAPAATRRIPNLNSRWCIPSPSRRCPPGFRRRTTPRRSGTS